jgi:hypothetical protein
MHNSLRTSTLDSTTPEHYAQGTCGAYAKVWFVDGPCSVRLAWRAVRVSLKDAMVNKGLDVGVRSVPRKRTSLHWR